MSPSVASTSTLSEASQDLQMSKAARKEEKRRRKEERARAENDERDVSMSAESQSEKRHKSDKHKEKESDGDKEARKREKRARKEAKAAAAAATGAVAISSQGSEPIHHGAELGEAESAFRYVYPVLQVSAPPVLSHNPKRAVQEILDTLLMRYVPQLDGVLLAHRQITMTRTHAHIDSNSAYASFPVGLTALVWAPRIGMRLEGQLKLSTPSHISLLIHGIFNASITAAHLPSTKSPTMTVEDEQYEWHNFDDGEVYDDEHGDAKIDGNGEGGDEGEEGYGAGDADRMDGEKSTGYWLNRETGLRLGEDTDGRVSFTVVGLTIANNLLSVYGSLLKAPFSVPAPSSVPQSTAQGRPTNGDLAAADEPARRVRFRFNENEDDDDDESEDEADQVQGMGHSNAAPQLVESHRKRKKERKSEGPRRKDEVSSASEGESEGESSAQKREKKRRKKGESQI